MARTAGSSGEKTNKAITTAALALFAERGYAAVSMRSIAQEVGIQVGALYNHFATKQEVFAKIMIDHMHELLAAWDVAIKGASTPVEKIETFVRFHVRYHMTRHNEVFTSFMELRSLEPDNFTKIEALRKRYEYDIRDILKQGRDNGDFQITDPHVSAMALIAMLTGVTTWYKPDGRLDMSEIEEIYLALAMRSICCEQETSQLAKKAS